VTVVIQNVRYHSRGGLVSVDMLPPMPSRGPGRPACWGGEGSSRRREMDGRARRGSRARPDRIDMRHAESTSSATSGGRDRAAHLAAGKAPRGRQDPGRRWACGGPGAAPREGPVSRLGGPRSQKSRPLTGRGEARSGRYGSAPLAGSGLADPGRGHFGRRRALLRQGFPRPSRDGSTGHEARPGRLRAYGSDGRLESPLVERRSGRAGCSWSPRRAGPRRCRCGDGVVASVPWACSKAGSEIGGFGDTSTAASEERTKHGDVRARAGRGSLVLCLKPDGRNLQGETGIDLSVSAGVFAVPLPAVWRRSR